MRHRIASTTGFGNPEPERLTNNIRVGNEELFIELLNDLIDTFSIFKEYQGFDYNLEDDIFEIGIEPAYQMDKLFVIGVNLKNKEKSYKTNGIAYGFYGSHIVSDTHVYENYKQKSKFVKFIDKWQPKLAEEFGERGNG